MHHTPVSPAKNCRQSERDYLDEKAEDFKSMRKTKKGEKRLEISQRIVDRVQKRMKARQLEPCLFCGSKGTTEKSGYCTKCLSKAYEKIKAAL